MGRKKPATFVFDPALFGRTLREQRRMAGYRNTKVFSQAIIENTGVFVDFDTLMKYERGEREPDVSKLTAIAFTLYGKDWPERVTWLLTQSFPVDLPHDITKAGIDASNAPGYVMARATLLQAIQSDMASRYELLMLRKEIARLQAKGFPVSKELVDLEDRLIPSILDLDGWSSEETASQTPPEESDGLDTATSADDRKGGKQ